MELETRSRCWAVVLLFVVASVLSSAILRIRVAIIATLGILFRLPACKIGRHVGRVVHLIQRGGFKSGPQRKGRGSQHGEPFGIWAFPSAARRDNYVGLKINNTRPDRRDAVRALAKRHKRASPIDFLRGLTADDVLDFGKPSHLCFTFQYSRVPYCILLQMIFQIVLKVLWRVIYRSSRDIRKVKQDDVTRLFSESPYISDEWAR